MQKIVTAENILPGDENLMKDYYNLYMEINRKYKKELFENNESFEDFSDRIKKKLETTKQCHLYLVYLNGTSAAWCDFTIWENELYYYIYVSDDVLDKEILNWIFSKNLELMEKFNVNISLLYTYVNSVINAFSAAKIPVHEKLMLSRLNREDMNNEFYHKTISGTNPGSLEVEFFDEVPDKYIESFLDCIHNGFGDLDRLKQVQEVYPKLTPQKWNNDKKRLKENGINLQITLVCDDAVVAGVCWVLSFNENKKVIMHDGGFTTVLKQYRGRGLAKFMKAKLYEHLLLNDKDFTYITTDTMPWNTYMYRINEEFGFKPYKNGAVYKLEKDIFKAILKN